MNINDLWLAKDCEGYWKTGYRIESGWPHSRFFNPDMPDLYDVDNVLLFKFANEKVVGLYTNVDEETAVRYGDLGEEE